MINKEVSIPENPTFQQIKNGIDSIIPGATLTLNNLPIDYKPTSIAIANTTIGYSNSSNSLYPIMGESVLYSKDGKYCYCIERKLISSGTWRLTLSRLDNLTNVAVQLYTIATSSSDAFNNAKISFMYIYNNEIYFLGYNGIYSKLYYKYNITSTLVTSLPNGSIPDDYVGVGIYNNESIFLSYLIYNLGTVAKPFKVLNLVNSTVTDFVRDSTGWDKTIDLTYSNKNVYAYIITGYSVGKIVKYNIDQNILTILNQNMETMFNNGSPKICVYFNTIYVFGVFSSSWYSLTKCYDLSKNILYSDKDIINEENNNDNSLGLGFSSGESTEKSLNGQFENKIYGTFKMDPNSGAVPSIYTLRFPYKFISSIKNAEYILSEDCYNNGNIISKNTSFIADGKEIIFNISISKINGTIKIFSN